MKTIKRTQMQPIEAETLSEYADKFNSAMVWVSQNAEKQLEFANDLHLLKGYIIFTVVDKFPETVEDIMELRHVNIQCSQCNNYEATDFSKGKCQYCRGVLKANDRPCSRFWDAWNRNDCWLKEGENKYDEYVNEFISSRIRNA